MTVVDHGMQCSGARVGRHLGSDSTGGHQGKVPACRLPPAVASAPDKTDSTGFGSGGTRHIGFDHSRSRCSPKCGRPLMECSGGVVGRFLCDDNMSGHQDKWPQIPARSSLGTPQLTYSTVPGSGRTMCAGLSRSHYSPECGRPWMQRPRRPRWTLSLQGQQPRRCRWTFGHRLPVLLLLASLVAPTSPPWAYVHEGQSPMSALDAASVIASLPHSPAPATAMAEVAEPFLMCFHLALSFGTGQKQPPNCQN
ncbi:hypothetical protein MRX96_013333 [Rhipicephalus microplus]